MDKVMTENEESYILMHSLQDANIPKFLAEDVPLFKSILDDLFPGITPPDRDYGVLEVSLCFSPRVITHQKFNKLLPLVCFIFCRNEIRRNWVIFSVLLNALCFEWGGVWGI